MIVRSDKFVSDDPNYFPGKGKGAAEEATEE
jgi:hypothetical protein